MWPSPKRNIKGSFNNKNYISSSSPSKSSSSATSFLSQTTNDNYPRKSMEEVWKDVNLTCLQDRPSTTPRNTNNHPAFPCMILQDSLARPFEKDPPTPPITHVSFSARAIDRDRFLNSSRPRPATMLGLNNSSRSDSHYIGNSAPISTRPNHHSHSHSRIETPTPFGSSLISPFDVLGSSSLLLPPNINKKWPQENHDNSSDRRHKRMIKNRESAARSRARKQAYTQELELEVDKLMEENAKLRRQQKKFLAAPAQLPKKNNLYRTLTAPF
eukprot:XP_015574357.1 protein FD [Ricinus communis]